MTQAKMNGLECILASLVEGIDAHNYQDCVSEKVQSMMFSPGQEPAHPGAMFANVIAITGHQGAIVGCFDNIEPVRNKGPSNKITLDTFVL